MVENDKKKKNDFSRYFDPRFWIELNGKDYLYTCSRCGKKSVLSDFEKIAMSFFGGKAKYFVKCRHCENSYVDILLGEIYFDEKNQ